MYRQQLTEICQNERNGTTYKFRKPVILNGHEYPKIRMDTKKNTFTLIPQEKQSIPVTIDTLNEEDSRQTMLRICECHYRKLIEQKEEFIDKYGLEEFIKACLIIQNTIENITDFTKD